MPAYLAIAVGVYLAIVVSACTPSGGDTTLPNEARGTTSQGSVMSYQDGSSVNHSDSLHAETISEAAFSLLQSCRSRSKQRITATDWQAARESPQAVEIRTTESRTITMDVGSTTEINALILMLDVDNQSRDSVLTLHAGHYRSPFVLCDSDKASSVQALLESAINDQ